MFSQPPQLFSSLSSSLLHRSTQGSSSSISPSHGSRPAERPPYPPPGASSLFLSSMDVSPCFSFPTAAHRELSSSPSSHPFAVHGEQELFPPMADGFHLHQPPWPSSLGAGTLQPWRDALLLHGLDPSLHLSLASHGAHAPCPRRSPPPCWMAGLGGRCCHESHVGSRRWAAGSRVLLLCAGRPTSLRLPPRSPPHGHLPLLVPFSIGAELLLPAAGAP